jgi:enterochelin esterase-like enzyme
MHLPRGLTELSLVSGPLHVALIAGALLAVGMLLLRRDRTWWTRRVPLAVAIAAVLLGAIWLVVSRLKSWPDGVPLPVAAWAGCALLGLVLLGLGWTRRSWRWRLLSVAAAVLLVAGAADGIDTVFGAFPTVGTAMQLPPYDAVPLGAALAARGAPDPPVAGQTPAQSWHPPAGLPTHGAVFQAIIPATHSRFAARPAWVYVPPAYLAAHRPQLPVLLLIGGQPGGSRDWLDGGRLAQQMDAWANAHAGLAPIVVMPDALGGETANPLCMDSALGRADTYLARDVTAWATATLQPDPDHARWAVGGFSYGGTCALQLAVAHPDLFPTFFDASGQQAPTLGTHAATVAATFGGDATAFANVDPLTELARHPHPGTAGYLVVGAQDRNYRSQQEVVVAAARAAGVQVVATQLPGGHNWSVWRPALTQALPWLAARMGLTP